MKNYKQKEYVRVIGNTSNPQIKEMNDIIGKVGEVRGRWYYDNTIGVYTSEKREWHIFKTSDTQKVFIYDIKEDGTMEGCVKDGYAIGEGDVITYSNDEYIAYDAYMYDGEWKVITHKKENGNRPATFIMSEGFKVTPKYPTSKETLSGKEVEVTIDGKTYKAVIK